MSVFFQRLAVLLLAVVLQRSFLDVLWPGVESPAIVMSVVVSLVFLFGFERGLAWVLLTIFLHLLLGEAGIFPMYAVAVAYGTSFIARRLRIEHRTQSGSVLASVTGLAAGVYTILLSLVHSTNLSFSIVAANTLESLLIFPVIFGVLRFREESIRASLMSEFRGLRSS